MVLVLRHLWPVLFFGLLVPRGSYGQDAPPPKPKSSTADSSVTSSKTPSSSKAPTGSILVRADIDSRIQVDDRDLGILKAGSSKSVRVMLGEHLVRATAVQGQEAWEAKVTLDKPQQVVVEIQLVETIRREEAAKNAELERLRAAKEAEAQLQGFMSSFVGQWRITQSNSDYKHAQSKALRADGTHNTADAKADIEETYILQLNVDNGRIEGSLSRSITISVTRRENACCTYLYRFGNSDWMNQRSANKVDYFTVQGAVSQNAHQIRLEARYERCVGTCGDMDRDPRSHDFDGDASLGSPTELEWTSGVFEPHIAVFKKGY